MRVFWLNQKNDLSQIGFIWFDFKISTSLNYSESFQGLSVLDFKLKMLRSA